MYCGLTNCENRNFQHKMYCLWSIIVHIIRKGVSDDFDLCDLYITFTNYRMLFQICTRTMAATIIHHAQQPTALKRCITSTMPTPRSLCNVTISAAVLYNRVPLALCSVQRSRCALTCDTSENVAHCANHGNYCHRNIEDLDRNVELSNTISTCLFHQYLLQQ